MSTVHEKRVRKLFFLLLAVMSLLLAGSTRKPESPAADPVRELSAVSAEEFSSDTRDGFRELASQDPVLLLQYCSVR